MNQHTKRMPVPAGTDTGNDPRTKPLSKERIMKNVTSSITANRPQDWNGCTPDTSTVVANIRAEYERLGLGVTELANSLGISRSCARRRWNGETQYTIGQIIMAGEMTELSTRDWGNAIFGTTHTDGSR